MPASSLPMPLAVLAFLGAAGLIAVLILLGLWRRVRGRPDRGVTALASAVLVLGLYLAALLGASLLGRGRVLQVGEEKYFCEIDCHLAYAVAAADRIPIGTARERALWHVTVVTRFDPAPTSPRRDPGATLVPGPRRASLRLSDGGTAPALSEADYAGLGIVDDESPLDRPLRPGESYRSGLYFLVPQDAVPGALLLEDDIGVSRLLIGHERSPLHPKVLLALPGAVSAG